MYYLLSRTLSSAPILIAFSILIIFLQFNVASVYSISFNSSFDATVSKSLVFFIVYCFLCCFVGPVLFARLFLNESLPELGLRPPVNLKAAFLLSILSFLLILPLLYILLSNQAVLEFYSRQSPDFWKFLITQTTAMPVYYFGEEFFFRGFLFLSLYRRIKWHSYWVTEVIFAWAHLAKPGMEILISFPTGIVLNYLALRTKSVYPPIVIHYAIGVIINVYVRYYC